NRSDPGSGNQAVKRSIFLLCFCVFLCSFIFRYIQRHVESITLSREDLGSEELTESNHKEVAQTMQLIADDLDRNVQLQTMINDPSIRPSFEVFMNIASVIFSDGKFNWFRVVTFFYFVSKLVIRAYKPQILELVRKIINWAIDYLQDNLINWIREQGGWEGIYSYFSTLTLQTWFVFLAGIFTAIVVMRKI
uniref:BCL2 associated X, apoptosis regulator a n=1 Tax=Kryptolebias marmoratus TaxID=37003 RepID=A0A3Q3B600_KRYMA